MELPQQSFSSENRKNLCLLHDFPGFLVWEHYHWNSCLQDENHEKAHQLFNFKYGPV